MARFFAHGPGPPANINLRAVPGLTAEQGRVAGQGARESTHGRGEPPATAHRFAVGSTQRKFNSGPPVSVATHVGAKHPKPPSTAACSSAAAHARSPRRARPPRRRRTPSSRPRPLRHRHRLHARLQAVLCPQKPGASELSQFLKRTHQYKVRTPRPGRRPPERAPRALREPALYPFLVSHYVY